MSIADVLPSSSQARSTRGRVPMWRFLLNGETLDVTATDASLQLVDSQHDEAVISVTSPTLEDTDGLVDSTLSFYWGVAPRAELFCGYITKVENVQGATGALTFTMTALGPTKALFDGYPHFWSRKTIPSAVSEAVQRNLLGYAGHTHTYVWEALAQTVESDWEIVNSLAQQLGWRLFSRYGVVLCYDPLRLFTESGAYTRLMTGTPEDVTTDRYLLDFQPTEVTNVSSDLLGMQYGYFTSSGAVQIVKQPGDFAGYNFMTGVVVENQDAAAAYTQAAEVNPNRWKQHAMARIWGDADIYPGMCVEVVTTNRRYLRTKYDGKWLVRGAGHQMDRQSYQTMLYLTRPNSTTPVGDIGYKPFWQAEGRPKPSLSVNEGAWVSSWANRRIASVT